MESTLEDTLVAAMKTAASRIASRAVDMDDMEIVAALSTLTNAYEAVNRHATPYACCNTAPENK